MRMFVGEIIPGLNEALNKALNKYKDDGVYIDRDGRVGRPAVIIHSDQWHGPKVTLEQALQAVEAAGFSGPRVANHVAWLCKGDPRVEQKGIIKLQRETEAQLKEEAK